MENVIERKLGRKDERITKLKRVRHISYVRGSKLQLMKCYELLMQVCEEAWQPALSPGLMELLNERKMKFFMAFVRRWQWNTVKMVRIRKYG